MVGFRGKKWWFVERVKQEKKGKWHHDLIKEANFSVRHGAEESFAWHY
jgi:hypothetical protein